MTGDASVYWPDCAVPAAFTVRQHSLWQISQAARQCRLAVCYFLMNDCVNVRVRGVEVNAGDPLPVSHVQIGLNLGHRLACRFAQLLFAFVVVRAEALEIFFTEADREMDEVTLSRSAAP